MKRKYEKFRYLFCDSMVPVFVYRCENRVEMEKIGARIFIGKLYDLFQIVFIPSFFFTNGNMLNDSSSAINRIIPCEESRM